MGPHADRVMWVQRGLSVLLGSHGRLVMELGWETAFSLPGLGSGYRTLPYVLAYTCLVPVGISGSHSPTKFNTLSLPFTTFES